MSKDYYVVTFRNSTDELTSMMAAKFTSIEDAKTAIKTDAEFFKNAHSFKTLNMTGDADRQFARWVNPKSKDYFLVQGQDGCRCIYQYFKI